MLRVEIFVLVFTVWDYGGISGYKVCLCFDTRGMIRVKLLATESVPPVGKSLWRFRDGDPSHAFSRPFHTGKNAPNNRALAPPALACIYEAPVEVGRVTERCNRELIVFEQGGHQEM
jgi:hypothetical protein